MISEITKGPTLDDFQRLVACHDLTYSYSDDPYYYHKGSDSYDRIISMARKLPRSEVVKIWNDNVRNKLSFGISSFLWIE